MLFMLLAVTACGSTGSHSSTVSTQPTIPSKATSASTSASTVTPVAVEHVRMVTQGSIYAFVPAVLTVKVDTEVIWTNDSNAPHTVSSDTGLFNTPNPLGINPGQTYAFTFTKPGTFSYYCNIHTYMTGKIIVTG